MNCSKKREIKQRNLSKLGYRIQIIQLIKDEVNIRNGVWIFEFYVEFWRVFFVYLKESERNHLSREEGSFFIE